VRHDTDGPMDDTASPATGRLLRDDLLMRVQRRIGLAPADGLGVRRRAVAFAAIAWLPIALWAWATGRAVDAGGESLLDHYQVSVRLLLAVPVMVVAESVALRTVLQLAPHCADVGLYHGDPSALRTVGLGLLRLRDATHPWIVALGAALGLLAGRIEAWALQGAAHGSLAWAGPDGAGGFGPAWYTWVGRPMFTACLTVWIWRAVLVGIALHRLASAGFAPVPTHPDRFGGYGFLQRAIAPFGLVAFALSAVAGAAWAHDIVVHGTDVRTYALPMALAILIPTLLFVAPMAVLAGPMGRARNEAMLRYGALVARHGDALRRRWIAGEPVDDAVLDAPEIGAAADAATLYESVVRMWPVPIGAAALLSVALPAALPMIAVLTTQIPLATIARAIAGALL
jgi:hypothetical protein